MPDSRLVIPDQIEDLAIDVLKRRHPEHLAKAERARGKQPETFERFRTVSHLSDPDARISGDTLPAVLVGVVGAAELPMQNERNALDVPLSLAVQVTVMGPRRHDTLRRRDVMAWTTIECLLQRLPRSSAGIVSEIRLTDYEPVAEADPQRILADAQLIFEVVVNDMVAIHGGLPPDDTEWPPGGPGGPPEEPYTPPVDFPLASSVTFEIEKEPIVE